MRLAGMQLLPPLLLASLILITLPAERTLAKGKPAVAAAAAGTQKAGQWNIRASAVSAETFAGKLPDRAAIAKMLRSLTAQNYAQRSAAESQLLRYGNAIVPTLQAVLRTHTNESTQEREEIRAILARIKRRNLLDGLKITLVAKHAPAMQILARIISLARKGANLNDWNVQVLATAGRETIHLKAVPFWTAVCAVARRAGGNKPWLGVANIYNPEVNESPSLFFPNYPTCVHGAFMWNMVGIKYVRTVSFWRHLPRPHSRMVVTLNFLVQPNLCFLHLSPQVHLTKAQDSAGHSLLNSGPSRFLDNIRYWGDPTWFSRYTVPLSRPPGMTSRLAVIKGWVRADVITQRKRMVVPVTTRPGSTCDFHGVRYTEKMIRKMPYGYAIDFTFAPQPGSVTAGPHPIIAPRVLATLQSLAQITRESQIIYAKGHTYKMVLGGGGLSPNGTVWLEARCKTPIGGIGPPVKMIFRPVTQTVTVKIPFVFRNLPLP